MQKLSDERTAGESQAIGGTEGAMHATQALAVLVGTGLAENTGVCTQT